MYQLNDRNPGSSALWSRRRGCYSIRLDANESCLQPPAEMQKRLLRGGFPSGVEPISGCLLPGALREFWSLLRRGSLLLVTPGDGSDELISILCNAFLMPGETLVTAEPDFSMYRFYASVSGAQNGLLSEGGGFYSRIRKLLLNSSTGKKPAW